MWFELSAVCDLNAVKVSNLADKFGVKGYFDLDELLLDEEISAIGLYTPPKGRSALMDKIISAGKDVITTKPFELDAEQGLKLLLKAKELGRVIHLNSPSPIASPEMQLIEDWRNQYKLGRPIGCRADVWCNYREQEDGSWYDDPQKCPVAPIFRIGIYVINDMVRLFGEAEEVQVMHSRIFTERPTPDNAQLGIKFKNGAICNIFASFCVNDGQYYKNSLVVNFQNGTICKNMDPLKFEHIYSTSDMMLATLENDTFIVKRKSLEGSSGQYQWETFYKSLNGEKLVNEVSPHEIIEGIKIINAMERAEISGNTEKV